MNTAQFPSTPDYATRCIEAIERIFADLAEAQAGQVDVLLPDIREAPRDTNAFDPHVLLVDRRGEYRYACGRTLYGKLSRIAATKAGGAEQRVARVFRAVEASLV